MRWLLLAMSVAVLLVSLPGCGALGGGDSSSHLPRPRPPDDDEPAPPKVAASQPGTSQPETSQAGTSQPGTSQAAATAAEQDALKISELERRKLTINKLRILAQALEEFNNRNESYPDQAIGGRLSWRVTLLPFLGQRELYLKFRLAEPWASAHNRTLLKNIPDVFQSVVRRDEKTNFLLITGPGTAYANKEGLSETRCPDGLDNTLLLLEVADHLAKPWTQPDDYVFNRGSAQQDLFSLWKECCFVVVGGGLGVRRMPANIADSHLLALLSPAGGESTSAKEQTAYPYPEVDVKLIAELERNPPTRFAEVATAKGAAPGTKSPPSQTGAANTGSSSALAKVEPPVPADPRLPVPHDKALSAASAIVKELYKEDYKSAKKRDEKRTFARKLLEQGNRVKVSVDPAGMFVLLREARDIGAQGGDIDTALAAVDKLGKTFRVDPLPMKLKALEQAAPALEGDAEGEKLFSKSMQLEAELLANDDFDGAKRALTLAATGARRCGKRELAAQVAPRQDELEEVKRAFDRVAGALRRLVLSPDDPTASGAVGKYLCLVKHNWARGLPLLARGEDEKYRQLAAADLSTPALAEAQAALGDRWWDLSEQHSAEEASRGLDKLSSVERRSARVRAAHWYKQALPSLPSSLASERAKQRIAAAAEKDEQHPKQAGTSAKTRSKNAR